MQNLFTALKGEYMAEGKETYVVDGYVFETESQARQAEKELKGIRYTKERLDMGNPEAVLSVYNRILKEKMFVTPVGYAFLRELQDYLLASPAIRNKDIHPLDIQPVINRAKQEDKEAVRLHKKEARRLAKEREKERKQKQKEAGRTRSVEDGDTYRNRFVNSLIVNVALILVVIAMFLMMHYSDIPTILNYENKLIDRYETWEEELNRREQRIEEYEEEYGITDGY